MAARVPTGLARFDSATAMVQMLACCLADRPFPLLGGAWNAAALVNLLPRRLAEAFYVQGGRSEAVARHRAGEIDAERIAEWVTALYPQRRYPAVAIGSSNGALIHFCALAGIPWLPQTVLTVVRHDAVHPDDPQAGLAVDGPVGAAVTAANPGVVTHHMHDPNQDRLMLRGMAYYRLKFASLPAAYRRFLREALTPGGTILVVDCDARWPTTRVGPRQVFQFGAFGGATVAEYFEGGPRLRAYLERYGSPFTRWDPPAPDGTSPEAEWGYEPALDQDLAAVARAQGARLARLSFGHPEDLSRAVADLYRIRYRDLGRAPAGLLAETFILMAPWLVPRLGVVPLWLVFNTESSAETLERTIAQAGPFEEIDVTLFSHGTEGIGVVPAGRWRQLAGLARRRGGLVGVSPRRYPRDFATILRFHKVLARRPRLPPPAPLEVDLALDLLRTYGAAHGVRVQP